MNKSDLANQYRQSTRRGAVESLPDVDALVALSRGERVADAEQLISGIARSALQSDLLHFARALEPSSAELGDEIAATLGNASRGAHTRQSSVVRTAAGRRRSWIAATAGIAAALVVAAGFWSQQMAHNNVVAGASSEQVPDRIFAALNDHSARAHDDVIFRSRFSGGS